MSNIPERKLKTQFPRATTLPSQSSKFWAKEKDRYLRQLLIADLEEETGREVVVYFDRMTEGISHSDGEDLSEILEGVRTDEIDLILQTPGGSVDAVEKLISVLRSRVKDYRVIVPNIAKSGGTVIALSSSKILLGVNSELGPIDPQFLINSSTVPCEFIARDEAIPMHIRLMAGAAVERMRALATKILSDGMLRSLDSEKLDDVIDKISSSNTYKSHGAVIDYSEAKELGLSVEWMPPDQALWRRVWLLHCCYDHDVRVLGYRKILEGAVNSIRRLPISSQSA